MNCLDIKGGERLFGDDVALCIQSGEHFVYKYEYKAIRLLVLKFGKKYFIC